MNCENRRYCMITKSFRKWQQQPDTNDLPVGAILVIAL